jgi:hypothetical protein
VFSAATLSSSPRWPATYLPPILILHDVVSILGRCARPSGRCMLLCENGQERCLDTIPTVVSTGHFFAAFLPSTYTQDQAGQDPPAFHFSLSPRQTTIPIIFLSFYYNTFEACPDDHHPAAPQRKQPYPSPQVYKPVSPP